MNILYVGDLSPGGTCRDRMIALGELGHEVIGLDLTRYFAKHRIVRSIQWRLSPKFLIARFNRDVVELFRGRQDIELVWIDKGVWVFPETLAAIKTISKVPIVHYTPDPQILFHRTPHFLKSISLYDHVVTTKTRELDLYRQLGAKHIVFARQSFCSRRYANPARSAVYRANVGFIGHCESHYRSLIARLAAEVPEVRVWGNRWPRASFLGAAPKSVVQGEGIFGEAYVNALASFRIGLGLLTKFFPEQHTTRSLEIPAAGTFLLAERTDEHLEMFDEGTEAEFFGSADELVSKARFYLTNESKRNQIAGLGHARCMSSGYDNASTLRRILTELSR